MTPTNLEQSPIALFAGTGQPLSTVDADAVRVAIEQAGAVLIRGFATTLADFASLGGKLCTSSLFNESPNREIIEDGASVQSVNLGADPFPLHPEVAREPWRPDLAMFSCLDPPGVGGQTNLCDGIAIADSLPVQLRAAMEARRIVYIKPASPAMLRYWLGTEAPSAALLARPPATCPYWFRQSGGQILRGFLRPLLEPTIFQLRPAFANFSLFARDYLRLTNVPLLDDGSPLPETWLDEVRTTARKLTYAHAWQKGDVLIADNSRFMHGRRAIADPVERRIATYFGYMRGIERRAGEPEDPVWRRTSFIPPDTPEAS
ncbi:MAG: TauD/TfdA family dioxygenase [Sphingomicrobium sp.]